MIVTYIPTNQQDSKSYHIQSESTHTCIHIQFLTLRHLLRGADPILTISDHFESAELVESRSFIGNTKDTEIAESVICL